MQNTRILVASSDGYTDLWKPFLFYLRKYWPDCPFQVVLGANNPNNIDRPDGAVVVPTAPDIKWGEHVRRLLAEMDSELVLLMMPDYFLDSPVDTKYVLSCIDYMSANNAGSIRLVPVPQLRRQSSNGSRLGLAEVGLTEPFSTSLAATLWSSHELAKVLDDGDSPWTFEGFGPQRRREGVQYYTTTKPVLSYPVTGSLVKGMWTRPARKLLSKDGMQDSLTHRPTQSRSRALKMYLKSAAFGTVSFLFPRWSIAFFRRFT
jgi:hypothetical protein